MISSKGRYRPGRVSARRRRRRSSSSSHRRRRRGCHQWRLAEVVARRCQRVETQRAHDERA